MSRESAKSNASCSGGTSRRDFMRTSAAASVAALVSGAYHLHAYGADEIRVGLIGCGRRGVGAAKDCAAAAPGVRIVAAADLFAERFGELRAAFDGAKEIKDALAITEETCFLGFGAYEKVLACDVNLVILAAPPGFRPLHLDASVAAGKNVFMEKPAAVDPVGVRSVLDSAEKAKQKGLAIVAGTQRRHQAEYVETIQRVRDGAIGEIVSGQCYWIGDYDYYTPVPRGEGQSDMEWQIRNWNYFTWLSGDHIVEQHVHNIDVINWALGAHPESALGVGGRQQRTGPEFGHIYDHFAIEFEYPGGVRVTSMCRQNKKTAHRVAEFLTGVAGTCDPRGKIMGERAFRYEGETPNPYVREHRDLIESIRAGKPLNEGKAVAESTMAAILGRMSAYTGQQISWKWAMEASQLDLRPPAYEMGALPVPAVAVPGETQLI